jgi:ribosomal protein L37AE/L43A
MAGPIAHCPACGSDCITRTFDPYEGIWIDCHDCGNSGYITLL